MIYLGAGLWPPHQICKDLNIIPQSWSCFLLLPRVDMQGSNAQFLASLGFILSRQHGCIWRELIYASPYLHSTSYLVDDFFVRKIGNMDKGIIEGSKDYILSFSSLRSKDFFSFLSPFKGPFFNIISRLPYQKKYISLFWDRISYMKLTLNSWSLCFCLPSVGITNQS